MAKSQSFLDLDVWKKSRELSLKIYLATASFPKEELFGLVSQMRRAAVSISSNIAEGCGRQHNKENIQFQYIAKGSIYELESQLYIAFDMKFIIEDKFDELLNSVADCRRLLIGFINYLETRN